MMFELKTDGTKPSEGFSRMRPPFEVDWPLMQASLVGSIPGLNH
jgi:hypothetical protein